MVCITHSRFTQNHFYLVKWLKDNKHGSNSQSSFLPEGIWGSLEHRLQRQLWSETRELNPVYFMAKWLEKMLMMFGTPEGWTQSYKYPLSFRQNEKRSHLGWSDENLRLGKIVKIFRTINISISLQRISFPREDNFLFEGWEISFHYNEKMVAKW